MSNCKHENHIAQGRSEPLFRCIDCKEPLYSGEIIRMLRTKVIELEMKVENLEEENNNG